MIDLDNKPHWCLSGGADGADLEWGKWAKRRGHGVIHFSFTKHKTQAVEDLYVLNEPELVAADPHCHLANLSLHRRFPAHQPSITNLLRRDWYQVAHAHACYAVSTFRIIPGATLPLSTVIQDVQVDGGTAWAVQMFLDRHHGKSCACYMFDQVLCHWFKWNGVGWECIYEPPPPAGVWAGIGSRKLLPMGALAIRITMDGLRDTD